MRVAAVTITYNDDYKFKEWYQHYQEYKDELFLHIVVDNNSTQNYLKKVKETFTDSYIIERNSNGGCTGAYNDGIRYALSIPEVDAIMLIGNDIRLEKGATRLLYEKLFADTKMGMISPVLLEKDSDIVEDFGCQISNMLVMLPYGEGKKISSVKEEINYCKSLTGGMNLAKREFYEKVGLQDDNLFMYSDEVDMGIRAEKCGFTMASIRNAVSWHQHINKPSTGNDRRETFTKYLAGRNKVYVAKKHFGLFRVLSIYLFFTLGACFKILLNIVKGDFSLIREYRWMIIGAFMGLIGNMKPNNFSVPSSDVDQYNEK